MIKHIESETIKILRTSDDRAEMFFEESVSGGAIKRVTLTVDELNDLRGMIDTYWNANHCWQHTSEAKEHHNDPHTPKGLTLSNSQG